MRVEDLEVQCKFEFPAISEADEGKVPQAITIALKSVTQMLEAGIDDNDEERCLTLLRVRLENAHFAVIGPSKDAKKHECEADVVYCSVNVNTASAKELTKALTGVGPITAQHIISNRTYTCMEELCKKVPSVAGNVSMWENTMSVRFDGEPFTKGMAKKGPSADKNTTQTQLKDLRKMLCAFKFLETVEELSALPDALQAYEEYRNTGIKPAKVGGNIRSTKSEGTIMCHPRNCPFTFRGILFSLCSRHIMKNWRAAMYRGKGKDAPLISQIAYASVLHMAENKVPLEEGKPGSVISIGEANGLDPMNVGYATKLFSLKMLDALTEQEEIVMDENMQDKLHTTQKWVGAGAKFDVAFDHRGFAIPERQQLMADVTNFLRYDAVTGERIDTANPGRHINGIPKCTAESTEVTICSAMALYKLCEKKGGKAATWVNLRATCSDVCEQLFAGLQNKSKREFLLTLGKNAMILRNQLDPNTRFYMPMNTITKQAKHSHGCFNDTSAKHDVPVARSVDDNTTTIGSMSLREKANVKPRKT